MANRASIAARAAIAADRINRAIGVLAEREGKELPPPPSFPYRQPELRAAAEQERLADFLEDLAGIAQTPADPDEPGDAPSDAPPAPAAAPDAPSSETPADADDEPGDGDEPTFGGHPLSFYEGMSDEEILALPRVGEATLNRIRAAQAE
jgi:hypothetical protein